MQSASLRPTEYLVTDKLRTRLKDSFVGNLFRSIRALQEFRAWEQARRPLPPPHMVKQTVVAAYAQVFAADVLIETGTYFGDMVYAMKSRFRRIVSIELSRDLCAQAQRRFRKCANVEILCGDSGKLLAEILRRESGRCLLWLDAHYSGGVTARGSICTAAVPELQAILNDAGRDHIILIDDARCFTGVDGYPSLEELQALIVQRRPHYEFSVCHDIIRAHPKSEFCSPL